MKRLVRCVALAMALILMLSTSALAAESNVARGSNYFTRSSVFLYKLSGTTFEAWFDITATGIMDELGASSIRIERSEDGVNWTTVATYRKDTYTNFICEDTARHGSCVTYTGTAGYYYRAKVILYAKNENGWAEMTEYTATMQL